MKYTKYVAIILSVTLILTACGSNTIASNKEIDKTETTVDKVNSSDSETANK